MLLRQKTLPAGLNFLSTGYNREASAYVGPFMNLDDEYGLCLKYQRTATPEELGAMPRSLQILNDVTAPALKTYLESAGTLTIPAVLHATTPILWLIDKDGNLRFALEEVLNRYTGAVTYILPRSGPKLGEMDVRLGHPALLEPVDDDEKAARIGGELFYDPVPTSEHAWVLTNNSGRFGKRPHITRQHLNNVKGFFARFGIHMRTFFIYTPD
ncbi:hypothetical protein ACFYE9_12095 [Rhizobium leguminosarum]|uniref:Uncharacterized protein n=2 Tax=Rhizobium leguminosarum TaxID=384 RepID=A0ACD5F7B3_RHILE|nr:hypothetical protein [Rhizobium leguminosarum]